MTLNHGICDSHCVSCPVGRLNHGDASDEVRNEFRPGTRKQMQFDIFAKVADEVARYPHAWLRLHARGEPLLHPQFTEMVHYAKQAGIGIVQAFTDAISLSEAKAMAIIEAGLDVLECSIHGHEGTYELLMRNARFIQVKENVILFRKLRDRMNGRTKLVISAVDQQLFQPDKFAHRAFWSQYADEVIYRPYHSWGNRIDRAYAPLSQARHACPQLWTRCTVGPTGKVLACFNSWSETKEEVLGDLTEPDVTIAGIWQSSRFGRIREDHAAGRYNLPCCGECSDWQGSSWGANSYETLLTSKLHVGDG